MANGEINHYKVRLVAKGNDKEFGIDYEEFFSPVVRLDTIKMLISIAAHHSWKTYQLDIKTIFLMKFMCNNQKAVL